MKILLKNANLYTPNYIGLTDVLIDNGEVSSINKNIVTNADKIVDCKNKIVCPMLVDGHEHLLGNWWNEEGILLSGVGTVVSCLANEQTCESVKNLIKISNKLTNFGITSFVLAGSKNYVEDTTDFILENHNVVGIKTALFQPQRPKPNLSYEKLKEDTLKTYQAGLKSNKTTQVHIHLDHPFARGESVDINDINSGKLDTLNWIDKIVEETGVPYSIFKLTHAQKYYDRILEYANKGCYIDYTAFHGQYDNRFDYLVKAIKDNRVDISKISISSDLGIMVMEKGNETDTPISLLNTAKELIEKGLTLEQVLPMLTTNALAPIKTEECLIMKGSKAKLLVLNEDLNIETIIFNDEIIKNQSCKLNSKQEKF